MKKLLPLLTILLTLNLGLNAQNYFREFGKIAKNEIDLKEYAPDKDAEAVVLFDKGSSRFIQENGGFEIHFERATRIKILTEAGINWSEVAIPFYREGDIHEQILEIEAFAYNFEDGRLKKTPLDLSTVYEEKIDNSWNAKKFALPNVKKGTIIEYRYKIRSQYVFNLRDWEFQWKIPVIYSEYKVNIIPFYTYTWLLQGASKFDRSESVKSKGLNRNFAGIDYQDMINTYIMENVPAFRGEAFISSADDYIIKLDFQLSKINYPNGSSRDIITTWEEMNKSLLKSQNFGKYVKKAEKKSRNLSM